MENYSDKFPDVSFYVSIEWGYQMGSGKGRTKKCYTWNLLECIQYNVSSIVRQRNAIIGIYGKVFSTMYHLL